MPVSFLKKPFFTALQQFFVKEKISIFVLCAFILFRAISLFTYHHSVINQSIGAFLVVSFFSLCKKNITLGWTILISELLLGSGGHFFEFQGLLLRTWLLGIFALWWLTQRIQTKKINFELHPLLKKYVFAVFCVVGFALLQGWKLGHETPAIIQDALMYGFLFLLFPALEFFPRLNKSFPLLLQTFVISSTLFSLLSFFLYSTHIGVLQNTYYHWFRNSAGGKITDLGDNFFRIVLPEHIFIVPILLVCASLLVSNTKNKKWWIGVLCCCLILALNFSRIYFLAVGVGLLALVHKNNFKNWLTISTGVLVSFFVCFCSLYFLASRGNSFGLSLLQNRVQGATTPISEISGNTRIRILNNAMGTIRQHPWIGSGLATTVTYIDPVTHLPVTRTQFDWGYLELIAELGIVGTSIFLFFLMRILFLLQKKFTHESTVEQSILRGLTAGGVSLFVMNLTTPALFQGFGILYFVFLMVYLQNKRGTNAV